MARPTKAGLDYFELDCQLEEKVRLIQAEFGLKGFAVVVKLYQKIYGEFGYYCEWNDDSLLLFMSENGLPSDNKNLINEIVSACIRRNIFSEELFRKFGILTSEGVQKRYLNAVSRREKVELKKEYLLLSVGKNQENVVINGVNVDRNKVNVCKNSQSRVEKSRGKKSRVEERKEEKNNPPLSPFEGETEEKVDKNKRKRFVPPTVEEVEDYCLERNNSIDAQAFVDFYSSKDWMIGKNRMKDWKAAVRTWERNRLQSGGSGRQKQNNDVNVSRQSQLDYLLGKIREEEGL